MGNLRKIIDERTLLLFASLLLAHIAGCAPNLPSVNPPENYKGPIAERPAYQGGDYWTYELADGRKIKIAADALIKNLGFPLWVGKWWSYESESRQLMRQPLTDRAPVRQNIRCEVTSFGKITVTAGTFEALECKCQCAVVGGLGVYDESCGTWTLWYAPQAKNVVKQKTESTATSLQLAEYKVSLQTFAAKPLSRPGLKVEQPAWKVGYEWKYAWKDTKGSGTLTKGIVREDTFEGVPSYVMRIGKNDDFVSKEGLGLLARMLGQKLIFKRTAPRQILAWPLTTGKEWRNSYTLENIVQKSTSSLDYRMVVSGIEEVKVTAGVFEAFKIDSYSFSTGQLLTEHWYSPAVKWFVKERAYQQDGVREEELMSFKVD